MTLMMLDIIWEDFSISDMASTARVTTSLAAAPVEFAEAARSQALLAFWALFSTVVANSSVAAAVSSKVAAEDSVREERFSELRRISLAATPTSSVAQRIYPTTSVILSAV